jgi:hypothetical protein
MDDCGTCDLKRGILCLDCYNSADDDGLPPTYAEYFAWAAWYPAEHRRRVRIGLGLAGLIVSACLFASASATGADKQLRRDFAALHAKTQAINASFARLQDARRCAKGAFLTDLAGALERAAQGGQLAGCTAFTRR